MLPTFARILDIADRTLDFVEKTAIVVLFIVSVTVLVLDIALRSTVGMSLSWAPELTRYAIVWLVFIGASVGARVGAHISIDLFSELLSERHALRLLQGAALISVLGCGLLSFHGAGLVAQMAKFNQTSPSLGWPMWAVYTAVPIGFGLMALRFLRHLLVLSVDQRRRSIAETAA